jgi:ER membrane protein complex subunit 1
MRPLLPLAALLIPSVLAVFPDEAYHIDYHHALLGLPEEQSTFFHQPLPNSKASLIYTLSEQSVIGAVNPKDGALVWRQPLPSGLNSSEALLRTAEDHDFVVSATDGEVTAWTASDGKLVWSKSSDLDGEVRDVSLLERIAGETVDDVKDVLVLCQASHSVVQRLDGYTGDIIWQYGDTRYGQTPDITSEHALTVTIAVTCRTSYP